MRWEHRTTAVYGEAIRMTDILHTRMHRMEVLGWELVSVCRSKVREDQVGYRLFFKRQVADE